MLHMKFMNQMMDFKLNCQTMRMNGGTNNSYIREWWHELQWVWIKHMVSASTMTSTWTMTHWFQWWWDLNIWTHIMQNLELLFHIFGENISWEKQCTKTYHWQIICMLDKMCFNVHILDASTSSFWHGSKLVDWFCLRSMSVALHPHKSFKIGLKLVSETILQPF